MKPTEFVASEDSGTALSLGQATSSDHSSQGLPPTVTDVDIWQSLAANPSPRKIQKHQRAGPACPEKICSLCGTAETPAWRWGGFSKDLLFCNACYLRTDRQYKQALLSKDCKPNPLGRPPTSSGRPRDSQVRGMQVGENLEQHDLSLPSECPGPDWFLRRAALSSLNQERDRLLGLDFHRPPSYARVDDWEGWQACLDRRQQAFADYSTRPSFWCQGYDSFEQPFDLDFCRTRSEALPDTIGHYDPGINFDAPF